MHAWKLQCSPVSYIMCMISSSSQCTYRTISGSQKLQVLQDAWAQCAGEWRKSELFKKFTERTTSSSFGARIWLTRAQIAKKYDSQSIADQICDAKVADPELAPHKQNGTQMHLGWRLGPNWLATETGLEMRSSSLGSCELFSTINYIYL